MDPFGSTFSAGASVRPARVEVYTSSFRVSGVTHSRMARVADILNQLSSTHLSVEQATFAEHGDPTGLPGRHQVLVPLDQVLFMIAPEFDGGTPTEMRVAKRATPVQLGAAPFVISGELHLAPGVGSVEGLLHAPDRFLAMTSVQISCRAHPELDQQVAAIAVQRSLAIMVVSEDAAKGGLELADVLDAETAAGWLRKPENG